MNINWSDFINLDGLRAIWTNLTEVFDTFEWKDILPDWDWGALIPDLPDIGALFGGEEQTIDVRLEGIARSGFNWDRGIEMVDQYRAGLIDLAELHRQITAEAQAGTDDAAREMLAELNAELQISDPQSLMQAAEAADALQERFPAISAAANEVLATTQTVIAQITATLASTEYTSEGARLVASIAAGMQGQLAAVRAASQAVANAIRSALPDAARVSVSVSGTTPATGAPIQARARGGSFLPGWLLTGEDGPELEYRTEGGFIAHNRALRTMLDMATRARDIADGISLPGIAASIGMPQVPALATVAAAGPSGGARAVQQTFHYNMPMSFDQRTDMEDIRATLRRMFEENNEHAAIEARRRMHD